MPIAAKFDRDEPFDELAIEVDALASNQTRRPLLSYVTCLMIFS
jgi:hypothetical protein